MLRPVAEKTGKPWARSSIIHVHIRPGERADLEAIAAEWDLTPSQLGFAIIADWLAKCRRRRLRDLPSSEVHWSARRGSKSTQAIVEAYTEYEHTHEEAVLSADEKPVEEDPAEAGPDEG